MKLAVVFGTRPELIKLAPLIHECLVDEDVDLQIINTGQHGEVLDSLLDWFEIVPDVSIDVCLSGQSLNSLSAKILLEMDRVLTEVNPDAVLVQGDTTTVSSVALAAANLAKPVIHLEAGLRSGNLYSPFPEEINRKLVGAIGSLHLTPTTTATQNLLAEGVGATSICELGNTVIDTLNYTCAKSIDWPENLLPIVNSANQLVVVTCHRRENWRTGLTNVACAVKRLAEENPQTNFVWTVHPNPKIKDKIFPILSDVPNVYLLEPLNYPVFCHLLKRATLVLTDSGGVQEEAPSLQTPVLVLRKETERPEGVIAGCAKLVGTNAEKIFITANSLLHDEAQLKAMLVPDNPYGDGNAAKRALRAIKLAYCEKPAQIN